MIPGSYRVIAFGRQVGIGVAGSYYLSISAVAKCNSASTPYCIPNELICAELGRFLGLPIPPAGIVHAPAAKPGHWFASLDFNLTGNALPPVEPTRCCAELPRLAAGLLLFDALVANCDRHRQNFSIDFLASPPAMNVFDHSHALFGFRDGQGVARLAELRDRLGMSGPAYRRQSSLPAGRAANGRPFWRMARPDRRNPRFLPVGRVRERRRPGNLGSRGCRGNRFSQVSPRPPSGYY